MITRGARGSRSQICIWWVFLEIYSSQNIQYLFYSIFCVCKLQRCSGDLGLGTPCYKIHVFMNTHFLTVIVLIITTCVPHLFLCPDTTSLLDSSWILNVLNDGILTCLIFTGHDIARPIPMQMFVWFQHLIFDTISCWFSLLIQMNIMLFTNCRHD